MFPSFVLGTGPTGPSLKGRRLVAKRPSWVVRRVMDPTTRELRRKTPLLAPFPMKDPCKRLRKTGVTDMFRFIQTDLFLNAAIYDFEV